jgi:hypothetical protein
VNVADLLKPSTIYINSATDRIFYTDNKSSVKELVVESVGSGDPTRFRKNVVFDVNVDVNGALSKGSGSFRIDHPLAEKTSTHHLVHSFIEGPFADLIYSGMVRLGDGGKAVIDIDDAFGMTRGTFEALTCNRRRSCTNENGFSNVRSTLVGSTLSIEAADAECRDEVFWQVIGERCDKHMLDTDWTDEDGRVIVEPLKQPKKEEEQ